MGPMREAGQFIRDLYLHRNDDHSSHYDGDLSLNNEIVQQNKEIKNVYTSLLMA